MGTVYKLKETLNKGQLVQSIRSYASPRTLYDFFLLRFGSANVAAQNIPKWQNNKFEQLYAIHLVPAFFEISLN